LGAGSATPHGSKTVTVTDLAATGLKWESRLKLAETYYENGLLPQGGHRPERKVYYAHVADIASEMANC